MATHSSILAWRIPWTEEPGRGCWGGYSSWDLKVLDTTEWLTQTNVSVIFPPNSSLLHRIFYLEVVMERYCEYSWCVNKGLYQSTEVVSAFDMGFITFLLSFHPFLFFNHAMHGMWHLSSLTRVLFWGTSRWRHISTFIGWHWKN